MSENASSFTKKRRKELKTVGKKEKGKETNVVGGLRRILTKRLFKCHGQEIFHICRAVTESGK